jgi:tellurite resistance protein TerC
VPIIPPTALTLASDSLSVSPWVYTGFIAIVLVLLALDLGVFHRKAHAPSMKESVAWTAFWVALALVFGVGVYFLYNGHVMGLGNAVPVVGSPGETTTLDGFEATKLYITAYLVEKSLSMDNVFVIAMIFTSLAIPTMYQHRVLFWGIVGALIMRGLMIGVGAAVVAKFSWIVYVFGALLIFSAIKMALAKEEQHDFHNSRVVRLISRIIPISRDLEGQRLISHIGGRWHGTPLFVALIIVEVTDLMFAVDSIPAVFAITGDPFIVFTSNIMAILGLRSLYFCLASAMTQFKYLKTALIAVLLFVGVKMCLVHTPFKIPAEISLAVVLGLLISGIAASLLTARGTTETAHPEGILPDRLANSEAQASRGWRWAWAVWKSNRTLRRVCVLTAGSAVILAGLLISPLPGPGLTILGPLGLGILASEFIWARRVADQATQREKGLRRVIDPLFAGISRFWIVPLVAWFWVSAWLLSEHAPVPDWLVWSLAFPVFTPLCYVLYRWSKVRAARRRNSRESAVTPGIHSPRTPPSGTLGTAPTQGREEP